MKNPTANDLPFEWYDQDNLFSLVLRCPHILICTLYFSTQWPPYRAHILLGLLRKKSSYQIFPLLPEISFNVWGYREQDLKVIIFTTVFGPSLSRPLHNKLLTFQENLGHFITFQIYGIMKHETWHCF